MSLASLKPFLIVLTIGLLGILVGSTLNSDAPSPWIALNAQFERRVDECQEGNPDWERYDCERIARGEIWVGMTQAMILASLGEPRSIEQPHSDVPTYEEWTYRSARYGEEVMRFQDGILLSWIAEPCDSCAVKPPRK